MPAALAPADQLILACARTDPDLSLIRTLVDRGPDWPRVLRKAERWGLVPLVYTNLRQAVPSRVPTPTAERLRLLCHLDAIHGMAMREVLRATLLSFAEARVPVIVLKGAALAALIYPTPALRPMRDIDLLVHTQDLGRADEVRHGMKAIPQFPASATALDVSDHIYAAGSSASRPGAQVRIPIDDLWERARPVRIESVATFVLSHEDLLLHLALQLAGADSVGRLRTLCDIGETGRRCGNAVDWSGLVAQAEAYRAGKELYHALRLAQELVGGDVSSAALTSLRARLVQLPLEDRVIAAVTRREVLSEEEGACPLSTFYTLGVHLLASRRSRHWVRSVRGVLARTSHTTLPQIVARAGRWRGRLAGSGNPEKTAMPARRLIRGPADVAVTYDQTATDGVGSQLQRIYAIYALSRGLHVKYVHTPLGRVGYQGLLPLLTGRLDPDFAARYNTFFSLPSDDFDVEGCERVRVHYLDEKEVERYRERAQALGRPVLLQAHEPYGYTDRHPAVYHTLRAVSPYREYRAQGPLRVCIHLRRGDNSVPGRGDRQYRLIPNAYYLRVCGTVLDALRQQDAAFIVRLHTEIPPRPWTLHPGISGVYFRLDQPATLDPATWALEEFEALLNLEMVLNVEPREALDDFATADILILSRSDF
ncbi:MAG TPA: nucleotidyltransferase family protein, partial [Candidatus Methylomirabilis sp.]|nr:nucleotidyltransferase family protein [Candidatus Methylomirabilis sp.]